MQALVNTAYSITLDLIVDGEYAAFDVGTTTYTIRNNDGVEISGYVDIAETTIVGQNRVTLEIPSDIHTITGDKTFEKRTVVLKTKHNSKPYTIHQSYYVTNYLNYVVTPSEVIALIGIRDGEILQQEVDLVAAYLRVADVVGAALIVTALASGTITQLKANDAIRAQAAIDLCRTIELRALKKLGSDSLSYTRFDGINFDKIRSNLTSFLRSSIADTQQVVLTPIAVFSTTLPTDAVTGG